MLVVVANSLPPAVRGRMKIWFIECVPNVFVSGIKDSVGNKVVEYLFRHCPLTSGLLVFQSSKTAPGYKIYTIGSQERRIKEITGLQLISVKKEK